MAKLNKKSLGALVLMALSFLVIFPPVSATIPAIAASVATTGQTTGVLHLTLTVSATDSIVIFEWIGVLISNACNYLLTPSDAFSNTYALIGSCVPDTDGGAIAAFAVSSSSQSGSLAINCNFGNPGADIVACYAFDITSPGAITELASATGNSALMQVNSVTAAPDSLQLATAGIQFFCQSVVGGDSGFTQYIPSSACNTGGGSISNYGMAGGYEQIGGGGFTTTFPMFVGQVVTWSELVIQVASVPVTTTVTSYSATITGWLVPDNTHLNNTMVLILFSLGGLIAGVLPFTLLYKNQVTEIGDRAIYPALAGCLIGSVLGDVQTNGAAGSIPFAMLIVSGLLLFLWWWNS